MTHSSFILNRRKAIATALAFTGAATYPVPLAFAKDIEPGNAKILMSYDGRQLGIKITRLEDGRGFITGREIGGDLVFFLPTGETALAAAKSTSAFKAADGKTYYIEDKTPWETACKDGLKMEFSSNHKGLKISPQSFYEGWPCKWAKGESESQNIANGDLGSGRFSAESGKKFQVWLAMNKNDLIGQIAKGAEFLSSGHSSGFINDGTEPLIKREALWY